ncbi:mannosyltransferase family protein [Catellatospora chokoriensis]|uniref:mannosyltransferase family protein n=1 Tax=Catellatospora chokoriensis TaxID=310353 RepID=UPI001781AD91|nr:mannosyltransferase family protein [Catellatospora chokoriensis]
MSDSPGPGLVPVRRHPAGAPGDGALPTDDLPESPVSSPDDEAAAAEPERGGQAAWRRWRPSVVTGFVAWASGLLAYFLVTAVAWMPTEGLDSKAGPVPTTFAELIQAWNRWDTEWYLIIADSGYEYDSRSTAFFPLYPMTVRALNPVLPGGTFEAGLIIGALACLAALILVHRLATEMIGAEDARRTTIYLLAFPTAFYLVAAYNESLFVALALASLYNMRRGRWWWAAMFAGYASATRMAGVMLGVAFGYEYLRQRGFSPGSVPQWLGGFSRHDVRGWLRGVRVPLRRTFGVLDRNVFAVLLVPTGLAAYMLFCYLTFGNALEFLDAQKAWFRFGFTAPWTVIGDVADLISGSDSAYHPDAIRNIVNLTTALVMLALLVLALVGPWKLGADHAYLVIFAAIIILMPLSNPIHTHYPLSSTWRYALECAVAFMVLARMGRNVHFDRIYTTVMFALQGAMIIVFVQNNFVG